MTKKNGNLDIASPDQNNSSSKVEHPLDPFLVVPVPVSTNGGAEVHHCFAAVGLAARALSPMCHRDSVGATLTSITSPILSMIIIVWVNSCLALVLLVFLGGGGFTLIDSSSA